MQNRTRPMYPDDEERAFWDGYDEGRGSVGERATSWRIVAIRFLSLGGFILAVTAPGAVTLRDAGVMLAFAFSTLLLVG